jgi:hypothetical protein
MCSGSTPVHAELVAAPESFEVAGDDLLDQPEPDRVAGRSVNL